MLWFQISKNAHRREILCVGTPAIYSYVCEQIQHFMQHFMTTLMHQKKKNLFFKIRQHDTHSSERPYKIFFTSFSSSVGRCLLKLSSILRNDAISFFVITKNRFYLNSTQHEHTTGRCKRRTATECRIDVDKCMYIQNVIDTHTEMYITTTLTFPSV